jgi:molybdopterin-guanine dinucleotide biosynthesis protein
VAATRLISIVGKHNAGKTTLRMALAAEFARRRLRIMTIEESAHPPDLDPLALARQHSDSADMVLVEGFTDTRLPKIEVYRTACGPDPLFDAERLNAADWVAMVTDNHGFRAPFPVFRFNDTSWLVTLANLAWDRAKVLTPG